VKFKLQGDAWTLKTGSASLCEHIIQSYVAIFRKTHTETRESSIGWKKESPQFPEASFHVLAT
jgi:hypothetical protein